MSGAMKYNYAAVDTSSLTFNNIVGNIMQNNGNIRGMDAELNAMYEGEGKDAWTAQIHLLISKLDQYNEALGNLQRVVVSVAGVGGAMNTTDKDQGSRFLAINI
jgi:uncharacterized protein YukE